MAEPVPVIEAIDLTELARELGYRCSVSMFPDLAGKLDPSAALARLREVLVATEDDPKTQLFRGAVLHGQLARHPRRALIDDVQQSIRFLNRVRAGIGGISDGGTMLALHVGAVPMLCTLTLSSLTSDREPRIVMTSPPERAESLLRRLLPY